MRNQLLNKQQKIVKRLHQKTKAHKQKKQAIRLPALYHRFLTANRN
jgi:23S rRNA maturation mini-RNase III